MAGSAPHPAGRWRSRLSSRLSTSGIVLYRNVSTVGDVYGHGWEVVVIVEFAVLVVLAAVDVSVIGDVPVVGEVTAMDVGVSSRGFFSEQPARHVPIAQIIDVSTRRRAITDS